MFNVNAILRCDAYKMPISHATQYNQRLIRLTSYYTARMSRIKEDDKIIMFGLQYFIKNILIDCFNETFFNKPLQEVVDDYVYTTSQIFNVPETAVDTTHITQLHELGYLPIRIDAIPEGERVNIKVPMFMVTNTLPDFVWLVNNLESNISANSWYPMLVANVGYKYRQVIKQFYGETVDDCEDSIKNAISEFGFRGSNVYESGNLASMGMMLSLQKNATVPAIQTMHRFYNDECNSIPMGEFGQAMISTEHSVMCSNYAIDGSEKTFIKKLITELFPKGNVSCVMDSYDYWNVVNKILPQLKEEILGRDGTLFVRGDSGDIVDIVCETVVKLWDIFGGHYNNKGYKVLDPHIRAIYGDSVTVNRAKLIYQRLKDNGFASCNVALGAGSFSLHCYEDDNGELYPFTRDTYGVAIKSTACTYVNLKGGIEQINIFKDPKTDTDNFKKSQRGCCRVSKNENGDFYYEDGLSFVEAHYNGENEMVTVFEDGRILREYSIRDIRNSLWDNKF